MLSVSAPSSEQDGPVELDRPGELVGSKVTGEVEALWQMAESHHVVEGMGLRMRRLTCPIVRDQHPKLGSIVAWEQDHHQKDSQGHSHGHRPCPPARHESCEPRRAVSRFFAPDVS